VGRRRQLQAGGGGHPLADPGRELGVGVEAGADRGAAQRQLADPGQGVGDPLGPLAGLGGVAGELLAEGDRDGVHQVGAPGLDHVAQLGRLGLQRPGQGVQRRQQVVAGRRQGGQVDGAGEGVVGGLAHVDVVVGVDPLAGQGGDDLVDVGVGVGARAGLEDVDRELVVVVPGRDRLGGGGDPLGPAGVQQPQVGVDPGRLGLDPGQHPHHLDRHPLPGDGEVLDRLVGLTLPQPRHRALAPPWSM
jgi:hypothetical protein